MSRGGELGDDYESELLSDIDPDWEDKVNKILRNPIFENYKDIDTDYNDYDALFTIVLLSNNHIVAISWDGMQMMYSYDTFSSIDAFKEGKYDEEEDEDLDFEQVEESLPNFDERKLSIYGSISASELNKFFSNVVKYSGKNKMAGGGVVIVKGKDDKGRTFKEEFDSYEDALQQMEGSHYSHLDRDSIRYYDSEGKMIKEQFGNGGGFSPSYYSILGGSTPFSDSEMKRKVVEPNLGSNFETIKMFENNAINDRYDELETKFPRQITNNWEVLYRSSSYQGYAKISPDGKVIIAAILDGGGIIGVFYVKSSGQKRKMANGGGVDGLKRFDVDFYDSSDANRDSSIEIIIRQNSLENAIEMAIKKAYDFQKNYIEFYHKNLFLGSVNFATSEQFRKGKDYDKFMSNDKYAKGGAIQIGSWVQEKKGNARGQVYEMEGEFVKLQDKYGNKSDKLFRISDFKKSSRPRYEQGGVVGQEVVIDYQGEEKSGYIKEVTDSGDYIVNTDDGRTVFAQKDIDLISLGGMHKFAPKPKQKRFGFFDHGGSMSDQGM